MTASCNSPTSSEHTDDAREAFSIEAGVNWSLQKPKFAKSRIQEELILGSIKEAEAGASPSLDLSRKELRKFPAELLELKDLKRLVLEGNEISELPDVLFDSLLNLEWLDLRNNHIQFLPSVYIGRHKCLRHLLLQGNQLRTLPLELGLVKTLNGLNICNNPLDFPPIDVIAKGTQEVKRFLRDVLKAKCEQRAQMVIQRDSEGNMDDIDGEKSSLILRPESNDSLSRGSTPHETKGDPRNSRRDSFCSGGDGAGIGCILSTSSDSQTNYIDTDDNIIEMMKEDGVAITTRKSRSKKQTSDNYLPSTNYTSFKMAESRQAAKHRDFRVKENAILQRRRDEEMLKKWRDEAKILQQMKSAEANRLRRESSSGRQRSVAKTPPYGTDPNHMRIMSNEDRIKADVQMSHERLRNQRQRQEELQTSKEEHIKKIHELERRIKLHTQKMYERRKNPPMNAHDEVEEARKDLETAKKMQLELILRRRRINNTFETQLFD